MVYMNVCIGILVGCVERNRHRQDDGKIYRENVTFLPAGFCAINRMMRGEGDDRNEMVRITGAVPAEYEGNAKMSAVSFFRQAVCNKESRKSVDVAVRRTVSLILFM